MSILVIGKGLVVGAVAAGALVAGGTVTHATTSSADASSSKVVCHRLHKVAPEKLRQDLKVARKLPQPARSVAVHKIRKEALAGHYGTKVEAFLKHRRHVRREFLSHAPKQLREDLRAAHEKPIGPERKAAVVAVWQKALNGTYGDRVQKRAEARKEHRATCKARHQAHQQSGTQSS